MVLLSIELIRVLEQFITLLVIVHVILSYIMDPYHPVRVAIDRLVEPMLRPIRSVVPFMGMFDLSPLILIILVQLIASALIYFLYSVLR